MLLAPAPPGLAADPFTLPFPGAEPIVVQAIGKFRATLKRGLGFWDK